MYFWGRKYRKMARYCFYCGRELAAGERCHCKDTGTGTSYTNSGTGSSGPTGGAGTKTAASGPSGNPSVKDHSKRQKKAKSSWKRRKEKAAEDFIEKTGRFNARRFMRLKTFADQTRTLFPTFAMGLKSIFEYFSRPATKTRQESMRAKRPLTYIHFLFVSLLTGVLALLMSRSGAPLFSEILRFFLGSNIEIVYSHQLISFFVFSFLAFLFIMTMCVSFYIAARFSNRKPTFRKVADLVSISLVYLIVMEIFMLLSILMGSRGSLSLILISMLLMGVTHLLSFRNALGISEDTVFYFLFFVYIFCYVLFRFFLYLVPGIIAFF